MDKFFKIQLLFFVFVLSSCAQKKSNEIQNVKEISKTTIEEFEMEINNGGFNQYFINSSGQNCYKSLKFLKQNGKVKTAKLLENAIDLINPNHIPEEEFIQKLKKNEVAELYNEKISAELNKLDIEFYKYPDGSLTE
ncbi:DMP19 family protein [Flavobacterium capsici]|uniref:DUF4375 domain-containing protein n=1 Tax=Flavobacterium capsici TaxID=3075618 RepID=A0AA96EWM2_9FLAO|nr:MULTISPECIES: DUF4375 domain-containing protein [unclassified Flavobacterium]WNM18190.1 DUF4375 domain-containing protein [Flavobacterium sp. PMR2A8]WNM22241.1 DUF4375 domain-containing protein [Flavobacterium sp. PMTSA4]